MRFELTQPESRPWIAASGTPAASAADADQAAAVLRADVERWSRWGMGLLGFILAVAGAFCSAGLIAFGGLVDPIGVLAVVVAALAGVAGGFLLWALWRTGRRTVSAAVWWLRLPYASGVRARRAGGWLGARTVNFEPRVFARILSGTLALLLGIAGVASGIRDGSVGGTPLMVSALLVGVIALAAGFGQLGGVMRLVSGLSEADPLWTRIRSWLRPRR